MFKIEKTREYLKAEKALLRELGHEAFENMERILANNPHSGPQIKKLSGDFYPPYRFRLGDYRCFYDIKEPSIVVLLSLRSRKDSYNKEQKKAGKALKRQAAKIGQ